MLPEILATVALALVVGGALLYIIRANKKGQKCIGCPYASDCAARAKGCSCHEAEEKEEK